ncbi:hypothetical protein PGB90_006004 [Kerria lacca]
MVRSKYRYISLSVVPTKKNKNIQDITIKHSDLYAAILSKVKKMHGDFGVASVKTGFMCKYCNEVTGVTILKIRHGAHKFISSIIPFISEVGKEHVQLHTIRTTASLHQAYKHLKIHQQKQLEKIWNSLHKNCRNNIKTKYEDLSEIEKLLLTEKQIRNKSNFKLAL